MRGNANCSEMVLTSLAIVLYSTRLALLLEGFIQERYNRIRMRGNANYSGMVLTSLAIVLYSTRLALLLEGFIQEPNCLL